MADPKDEDFGKKCAGTKKAISRARRYYRDGNYFANKTAYINWRNKARKKAAEEAAEAAAATEEAAAE